MPVGLFDPTLIENGLYTVQIEVTDSDGGISLTEISVVVDGQMKLGSFDLAFLDAQWQNGVAAMTLGRTYTTLAKDRVGDFGNGWDLTMSGPTVATNGPWARAAGPRLAVVADSCSRPCAGAAPNRTWSP